MDIENVKKNFDRIRRAKGLKIDEICVSLGGITRQAVYNYMKTGATLSTLNKIAGALDVETWELLKPDTTKPTNTAKLICPHCNKLLFVAIAQKETDAQTQAAEAEQTE